MARPDNPAAPISHVNRLRAARGQAAILIDDLVDFSQTPQVNGEAMGVGGTSVKLVDVANASAQHGLTAADVNVGDIVRVPSVPAVAEVTYFDCASATLYPGEYFVLREAGDSTVAFWLYDVNSFTGTAPGLFAREVQVNIDSTETHENTVGNIAGNIDSDAAFSAINLGETFTVTAAAEGARTDATATAGVSVVVLTQGAEAVPVKKFAVIDTAHLDDDALGYARFAS